MSTRHAYIKNVRDVKELKRVQRYLPSNYQAVWSTPELDEILIHGEDNAGWTLDGYVIPRLASGLIFATEVAA
jgi:hypothetical protein